MKAFRSTDHECRFKINSSLDLLNENDKEYHYRFFGEDDFDEITTSPIIRSGPRVKKYLSVLICLLVSALPVALRLIWFQRLLVSFGGKSYVDAFHNYENSDVVVSKGGHILVSMGGVSGFMTLVINIMPMIIGLAFKKKVVIYGQSIGPFVGWSSNLLAKIILKKIDTVIVREEKSYDYVKELTGMDKNLCLGWDTAFAIEGGNSNPLGLSVKYAVITVRRWNFPERKESSEELMGKYVNSIIAAARFINVKYGLLPVFVPQVVGPTKLENDLTLIDEIEKRTVGVFEFIAVKEDFSVQQLAEIYGHAEILLGTRFHSVILSLASGTPSLAISYYGYKTKGIMEMMELDKYVFDIYHFENIESVIDDFMDDLPRLKKLLPEKITEIREDINRQASQILLSI